MPSKTRAALDAAAALLARHEQVLLLRVEASEHPGTRMAQSRWRAFATSQARADRVLQYLWKDGGVWAERLDAVGYGARALGSDAPFEYDVRLRIVQRARPAPSVNP